jgi:MOSC domain-containing protein YiiM
MTKSGRCGWYYRVLEAGSLAAGDAHDVVERPNPDWPVARFARAAASKAGSVDALHELTTLPGLTPAWQNWARQAIARQTLG